MKLNQNGENMMKKARTNYELLERFIVKDCVSLEQFLDKYRKPERFKMRGKDYSDKIIKTHKEELLNYGITWIGNYESNTGKIVAYAKTINNSINTRY